MRALFLRLSISVLLSLLTLVITFWWSNETLPKTKRNSTDKPIAFVGNLVNDVLKRPADRLLWQNAETNEPLFNGEAIRTPADATAKILFEGSGRVLDIEPDSLIVIQKSEGLIALDLMEGSIQVAKNKDTGNESSLILKSENGQIDLSKATASLSKNKKTGLSLEVLEGTASLNTRDGKKQLIQTGETGRINQSESIIRQNQIKLLKPHKTAEINGQTLEPTEFTWSGAPVNSEVGIWIGTRRSALQEIQKTRSSTAKVELNVNTKYFWKIVVYDSQSKIVGESSIAHFETRLVLGKTQTLAAATATSPKHKSQIQAEQEPQLVKFKWTDVVAGAKTKFVLSHQSDLNPPLHSKVTTELGLDLQLNPGNYFWQLTTTANQTLANGQSISQTKTSSIFQFEIVPSQIRNVQISWSTLNNPIHTFYVKEPRMLLSWTYKPLSNLKTNVSSWKVELKNKTTSEVTFHKSLHQNIEIATNPAFEYFGTIQAFDEKERLLGTSEERTLTLSLRPLLISPQLIAETKVLQANPDGSLPVSWQKIAEAKEYELQLLDAEGKLKNKKRYQNTQTIIKNLFPGEYKIRVLTIDQFSRLSEPLTPRSVLVPAKSGLRAPSSIKAKVQGQRGSE